MENENSYVEVNDTSPLIQGGKNQQSEFDVCLEEYKTISAEILKRVEFQQMIINYQIIFSGAIITAGLSLLNYISSNTVLVRYFLLLSPFPFYFLSWSFSNHDLMIVALARYINIDLRPRIINLVGGKDVLRFEEFLKRERDLRAKIFGDWPTIGEEYLLPFIFPAILISIYLIIFPYNELFRIINNGNLFSFLLYSPMCLLQPIVLILDIIFFIKTKKLRDNAGKNYCRITIKDSGQSLPCSNSKIKN